MGSEMCIRDSLGTNDTGIALQLLPDGLNRLRPAAAGVGQRKAAVIVGAVLVDVDLFGFHLLRVLSGEDALRSPVISHRTNRHSFRVVWSSSHFVKE